MTDKIVFVSLGPGDPELITLKGFKALQQADLIYCPSTLGSQGRSLSRAADIVRSLGIDIEKLRYYELPMSKQRDSALMAYRDLAEEAIEQSREGYKVAITAEGDGGIYSSSQYINEMLTKEGIATNKIAGIPAFVACGALANLHIVSQEESLEVVAVVESLEDLTNRLKEGNKTLVLMKLSQSEEMIKEVVSTHLSHEFHYFENAGVKGKEFYTSKREEIVARQFPYFSIMIIKQK